MKSSRATPYETPRIVNFVVVGAAGFAIQITAVACLTLSAGWKSAAATALAVELAVLHNFFWHQCWTWKAREAKASAWILRLARFHVATGTVSLAGNLIVTIVALDVGGLSPVAANVVAVAVMALANFHLADRWIFIPRETALIVDHGGRRVDAQSPIA